MPLKFAVYLFAGDAQRAIAREDLIGTDKRDGNSNKYSGGRRHAQRVLYVDTHIR